MAKERVVDKITMDAVKLIVKQAEEDIPSIGHTLFVEKYLPILAGKVITKPEFADDKPYVDLSPWIVEIAKHASNPVRVLDDTTGKVLYTVPPIVGPFATYYAASGRGLASIADETLHRQTTNGRYASAYLDSALKGSFTSNPVFNPEATKEWNHILVVNGYEPLPGFSKDSTSPIGDVPADAPPSEKRVITDDDYDDL